MNMLIGYGGVALFFALIVYILERSHRAAARDSFSDYATGGRSFGSFYSMMAFVNTWLPGAVFIAFAGYSASSGVIGFYAMQYSLLAIVLMFLLARPVHVWGKMFDLRTQADLLGLRYNSSSVRVIAAVIGILTVFPWIVLGMQSLTLVFTYLSFGAVSATSAVFVGIGVLVVRQIWTARFGARGVIVSDMVQGIMAYFIGTLIALGLLLWLVGNGHGLGQVDSDMFTIPGPGSDIGPLYLFSLLATGALGGWCWPEIFVRLFSSRSTRTIQNAAIQAAPLLLVFSTAVTLLAIVASTVPGVSDAPDAVWFITAGIGGVILVTLAGICVVAATMGNVGATLHAMGSVAANDLVGTFQKQRVSSPRGGQVAIALLTIASGVCALATTQSEHTITLAIMSYQGVVQLAPTLFLGIFWRKGTAPAAVSAMLCGFTLAAILQWFYPESIPAMAGLTSGVVALILNTAVYVAVSLLFPAPRSERERVEQLFEAIGKPSDNKRPALMPQPI